MITELKKTGKTTNSPGNKDFAGVMIILVMLVVTVNVLVLGLIQLYF